MRATGEAGPNDVGVHGPEHSGCSRAAAGHTRILATTKNSTSHAFATLCVVGSRPARPGTPRHAVLPPGLRTVPHGAVQQGRQRECTSRGRWQTEQKPAARRSAKLPPAPSRTCHPGVAGTLTAPLAIWRLQLGFCSARNDRAWSLATKVEFAHRCFPADRETQAVGSGDGRACGERRRSSLQTLASIVPLAQEASATMGRLEEYEVMKVRQDACVHCQRTDAAVRRPLRAYYCSLRGIKYSLTAVCAYFCRVWVGCFCWRSGFLPSVWPPSFCHHHPAHLWRGAFVLAAVG